MEMDTEPVYAQINPHVPVLAVFFDGQKDLMADYRLGRQSVEVLLRILPSKNTQRLVTWGTFTDYHILAGTRLILQCGVPGVSCPPSPRSADWCTLEWRGLQPLRQEVIKTAHRWSTGRGWPSICTAGQQSSVLQVCGVPLMAVMSTLRPPQDPMARITSTESSSHSYNCRQYVMGRASSSTHLWTILALSTKPESGKNSRIYREALYPPLRWA